MKTIKTHRLVLEAFIGPRPQGFECNHIDGRKKNNPLSNLEWVTHPENINHAWRTGLAREKGENHHNHKLKNGEVLLIKKLLASGIVNQRQIAEMFKTYKRQISKIKTGYTWSHIQYP